MKSLPLVLVGLAVIVLVAAYTYMAPRTESFRAPLRGVPPLQALKKICANSGRHWKNGKCVNRR